MLVPVLAFAFLQQHVADISRASYLYTTCKAAIRVQDDSARATEADADLSYTCTTYINGFVDGAGLGHVFCDDDPTMATLARVYVSYLDKHPTKMEVSRARALTEAIMDAYPCTTKR